MELTHRIMKKEIHRQEYAKVENAYYTTEMLEDNLAVSEKYFFADGEVKTMMSLRHLSDDGVVEYELYWGQRLYPVQVYRIVLDVLSIYERYQLDDFMEVISGFLSKGVYSSQETEEDEVNHFKEIEKFFSSIKQD